MGRPLAKRFFGDAAGRIACSADVDGSGAEACFIVEQRSNSKYRVQTEAPFASNALVIGVEYIIVTVGTGVWASAGASSEAIGTVFTATDTTNGVGDGTADARRVCRLVQGNPIAAGQMQVDVSPELLAAAVTAQIDFGTGDLETLVDAQTEANYTGVGSNGTFVGGSGGINSVGADDGTFIALNDGTIITVDVVAGGAVTEFTVDSSSATPLPTGTVRTQVVTGTTYSGTGFTLTPGDDNEVQQSPVTSVAIVDGGSGYFTNGTFTISVTSDAGKTAGALAVIAYTVNASQEIATVAVQSGGAGYSNSLAATTDVMGADLPGTGAGQAESARIINARTVKTFEGNQYMWPAVGGTGTGGNVRVEADLGTQ